MKRIKHFIIELFNLWRPFPEYKPRENGWYICSIRYGDEHDQAYVMDLYWYNDKKEWRDNRRLDVYNMYRVYGYNVDTGIQDMLITRDNLCVRTDVIAFKKVPKIYK